MGTMATQITSLSTVHLGADQSCGEFTGDQWIPRTNGQ